MERGHKKLFKEIMAKMLQNSVKTVSQKSKKLKKIMKKITVHNNQIADNQCWRENLKDSQRKHTLSIEEQT